jgi:dsRNA-specific ribonuclease
MSTSAKINEDQYFGLRNKIYLKPKDKINYTVDLIKTEMLTRNKAQEIVQTIMNQVKDENAISIIDMYAGLGSVMFALLEMSKVEIVIWYSKNEKSAKMVENTLESYQFDDKTAYGGNSSDFSGIPKPEKSEDKDLLQAFVVYIDTFFSTNKKDFNNLTIEGKSVKDWLQKYLIYSKLVVLRVEKEQKVEAVNNFVMTRHESRDFDLITYRSRIYDTIWDESSVEAIEKALGNNVDQKEYQLWHKKFKSFMDKFLETYLFPDKKERDKYLTPSAMKYWEQAFTHESFDISNNYETLELLGDRILESAFSLFLMDKFPDINQHELTVLKSHYMSKKFQSQQAQTHRFGEYVRIIGSSTIHVYEDLFESFIGALSKISFEISDTKGLALDNTFVFLKKFFRNIPIDRALAINNPKTILDQIYMKLQWKEKPLVRAENIQGNQLHVTISMTDEAMNYLKNKGIDIPRVVGQAYGYSNSEKSTRNTAYADAIATLSTYGIDEAWANKEKEENSIANVELKPYMDQAQVRYKKEGYSSLIFFVPKTLSGKNKFVVQLKGIKHDGKKITLMTATGATLLETKKTVLDNYGKYK